MADHPIAVSEQQVLYFRARRGHLAGPGADDAVAAAHAILGAQSQQLPPSLLALSMRTRDRPTAAALKKELFEPARRLVRTWGQRQTIHVYDAASEWALVATARAEWAPGGRRGVMPTTAEVDKAQKRLDKAKLPVTRTTLFPVVSRALLREAEEKVGTGDTGKRFAAGRLLWHLALRGDACVADKKGSEQQYAARKAWFPDLAWPRKSLTPAQAAIELTRRYLGVHGPATVNDIAHFFGARIREARGWVDALRDGSELVAVECGDRNGLLLREEDVDDLGKTPPEGITDWPLRLLPMWESMLMGHADKSWTVPYAAEMPIVWGKAAVVAPVVLARGRAVATWSYTVVRRRLAVTVSPLSLWRKSKHLAGVRREAQAVAAHFELSGADVTVERPADPPRG